MFIMDPPNEPYSLGFLAALVVVYEEAFKTPKDDPLLVSAKIVLNIEKDVTLN